MKILMTQLAPNVAVERLKSALGPSDTLDINPDAARIWSKQELIERLKDGGYDGLYCMLTNPIDAEVLDAAPDLKVIANMAVGHGSESIMRTSPTM